MFPFSFQFRKKNYGIISNIFTEWSFDENKEAGEICFEIRIPRKKNKELLRKVTSKNYGSYFDIEKIKDILVCQKF